ncbi:hypothetical protein HJFPF1_06022 [Paramyrothecium foliicola]|nr:hypothetical protein HJFPF1_06022 [Paramyrothecium foliicola]
MTTLNDNSPVFCTAEITADLLTKFFEEAYSPSELVDELGAENVDIGVLINTDDVSTIAKPTLPPVSNQPSWPFKSKSPDEIWDFAQQNIKYPPIYNKALAILDDQTVKDQETCLLVTQWSLPKEGQPKLITVRSDFKSALMLLNNRNLAIAGDEHFKQTDSDGVIRMKPQVLLYSAASLLLPFVTAAPAAQVSRKVTIPMELRPRAGNERRQEEFDWEFSVYQNQRCSGVRNTYNGNGNTDGCQRGILNGSFLGYTNAVTREGCTVYIYANDVCDPVAIIDTLTTGAPEGCQVPVIETTDALSWDAFCD